MIFFAFSFSNMEAKPFSSGVNFGIFYSELSPYGEWIEIDYDVYAWRPYNTSYNWQPYTVGGWVWTSQGWYWDSYEPFGWATYHYGRWYFDDFYGWLWMPGYEWAPAWVEWRYNNSYIGWSPLPPYAVYRYGVGIHFSINWYSPYKHWRFVTYNHFHRGHVHHYFVPVRNNYQVFNTTKYRTNYYSRGRNIVNGGIDRGVIEQRSGQKIRERNLQMVSKSRDVNAGRTRGDETVRVYRPSSDDIKRSGSIDRSNIKSADKRSSIIRDAEVKKIGRETNSKNVVRETDSRSNLNRNNSTFSERKSVERKSSIKTNRSRSESTIRNNSKSNSDRKINSTRKYNYYKPKTSTREKSYKLKVQSGSKNNTTKSYSPKVERKTVVTPNGKISRRERSVAPNTNSRSKPKVEIRQKTSRSEMKSNRSNKSSRSEKSNNSKSRRR